MFFKGRFGQRGFSKVRFLDGLFLGLDRFFFGLDIWFFGY